MNTAETVNNKYMNIARVSKEEELQKKIQEFIKSGLLNYQTMGYPRWFWQYMENPFSLGQDPAAWIYNSGDKAVCYLGTIPVELRVGSKAIRAAWAVDFMTLPEYRRRGLGRLLVDEADKHFDLLMAVGVTQSSFNLFVKMGWIFLGHLPYYVKILDLKSLLKTKIKNRFIFTCLFMPLSLFLSAFNLIKRPRISRAIEVSRINSFNEEADLFWREISGDYKIVVTRNKTYLNWKYDRQPDMHYVKFRAVRKEGSCGYVVVRSIKNEAGGIEGMITDIIVRPSDKEAINTLLFTAIEHLRSEGCTFVRCCASHPDIQKIISSCGFIRRNCPAPFLVNKNISGLDGMNRLDNWSLTAGDCDIDRLK